MQRLNLYGYAKLSIPSSWTKHTQKIYNKFEPEKSFHRTAMTYHCQPSNQETSPHASGRRITINDPIYNYIERVTGNDLVVACGQVTSVKDDEPNLPDGTASISGKLPRSTAVAQGCNMFWRHQSRRRNRFEWHPGWRRGDSRSSSSFSQTRLSMLTQKVNRYGDTHLAFNSSSSNRPQCPRGRISEIVAWDTRIHKVLVEQVWRRIMFRGARE
jgi:hypothetical protein